MRGPSDELRFYTDETLNLREVEYVYMDWFDGAKKRVSGRDFVMMGDIWEGWKSCGIQESLIKEANRHE